MAIVGKQSINKKIARYINQKFPNIVADINVGNNEIMDVGMGQEITMTAISEEKETSNARLIQAVAGTAIMMLLFSITGMGAGILTEKGNGTLKRLLYSPIKLNHILIGKMLASLIIAIAQLSIMFVFAYFAFGLNLFVNIPALIFMIIATAFAISDFGMILAAISKTQKQAQSLGTLIILIMSAIGGSMIPLFIMPAIMQKTAVVSVNYWGIKGFYDIFLRELTLPQILPRIFVLLGIGLLLMILSIRLFKKNVMKLL